MTKLYFIEINWNKLPFPCVKKKKAMYILPTYDGTEYLPYSSGKEMRINEEHKENQNPSGEINPIV